jgi:hypothetical protein
MGFFGGLVMSAIKRDKGVKDWGHLIAGHGGFIDRLDSVIFAAPIFFHLTRYWSFRHDRPRLPPAADLARTAAGPGRWRPGWWPDAITPNQISASLHRLRGLGFLASGRFPPTGPCKRSA